MNKILIIGCGCVGSAISSIFKKSEKTIIDPKITNLQLNDLASKKYDIIFVCVDTPKNENFQTLFNVLSDLNKIYKNAVVCCKSTASPNFYSTIEKQFKNLKILFCPEFLSRKTNLKDFKNTSFLILGGNKKASHVVAKIFKKRLKKIKKIIYTDIKTAALMKYTSNAFLALKITFFNEMFYLHKHLQCVSNFKEYINIVKQDSRIGSSHMFVPGPDGKMGWGGHCYDKDIFELERFSKSKLIKFLRKLNFKHRSQISA
jgi:UDPglucose 6-dehydrogenase